MNGQIYELQAQGINKYLLVKKICNTIYINCCYTI